MEIVDYFDEDGQPTAALTPDQLFKATAQILGAVLLLHRTTADQLDQLRALAAELKIKLNG